MKYFCPLGTEIPESSDYNGFTRSDENYLVYCEGIISGSKSVQRAPP